MAIHDWFLLFGGLQLLHSQEELWTGFHKKWFLFKMPFWVFLTFELVLSATIIVYMVDVRLAGANVFMPWFIFAMLLNGMDHIIWAAVTKQYVPGLITAPGFVLLFGLYYASLI